MSSPPIASPNTNVFQFEPIPEHAAETDSGETLHNHTKPVAIGKNSVLPKTPMHTGNLSAPTGYLGGARRGSGQFTETSNGLCFYKCVKSANHFQGVVIKHMIHYVPSNLIRGNKTHPKPEVYVIPRGSQAYISCQ